MQKNSNRLTTNGCLYLTMAFKQHYVMQVLTYSMSEKHQLCLILYDGQAYVGAIYPLNHHYNPTKKQDFLDEEMEFSEIMPENKGNLKLNVYDIVRVYPQLVIQNQPMHLYCYLEFQGVQKPLGSQIITLHEFMHKRSFHRPTFKPIEIESDQQVRKMVKVNSQIQCESHEMRPNPSQSQFQNRLTQLNPPYKSTNQLHFNNQVPQRIQMNEQVPVKTMEMHQDGQIFEQHTIQYENINIVNKSHSTNISGVLLEEKDSFQGQGIDIQEFQTQKKGNEAKIGLMEDQCSKETKRVSFVQRKSNNIDNMIQEKCQAIKEDRINQINKRRQISQIFQIQDDEQVIIVEKSIPKNQESSFSDNFNKSNTKIRKNDESTMFIQDLYERMHRFQIQCRVNFICKFVSQKGVPCTKLFLIDEKGDEIVCMLFEKATQRQMSREISLVKGKVYTFENGEVTKEDDGFSICVPWSGIIEQKKFFLSFNPKKMLKVGQIYSNLILLKDKSSCFESSKYSKQITISGIFVGFLQQPKLAKFQFKVVGLLCDPQSQKSITFVLFVDELSSFPEKGSVTSLHNMRIFQDEHIIRLQPTRRAYILNEKGNTHEFFSQLIKSSEKGQWKLMQYRNLSEIAFVSRNISELKHILARVLEHDLAYSEIDCSIVKIAQKRLFNACISCKKETKPEQGLYTYCPNCRKINKYIKRAVFQLQVSDSTGSIQLNLCNANLEGFINMSLEQYLNHENDDRQCFLQLCTYQNIILKVKSERIIGGSNHTAIAAEKPSTKRAITQITNKILEDKTKYLTNW